MIIYSKKNSIASEEHAMDAGFWRVWSELIHFLSPKNFKSGSRTAIGKRFPKSDPSLLVVAELFNKEMSDWELKVRLRVPQDGILFRIQGQGT